MGSSSYKPRASPRRAYPVRGIPPMAGPFRVVTCSVVVLVMLERGGVYGMGNVLKLRPYCLFRVGFEVKGLGSRSKTGELYVAMRKRGE